MSDILSRRDLFKRGGVIAVGLTAPRWLSGLAHAEMIQTAKGKGLPNDHVLVVCQFSGGNDGLNMVIPYSDPMYRKLRPNLGIAEAQIIRANESMGFHPSFAGVSELFKEGKVAIIQNVGYPQPNRSHFKSMDIWQSASPDGKLSQGWIGRYLDNQLTVGGPLNPVMALGLSTDRPLALAARQASVPCFASLADVTAMVGDPDAEKRLRMIQGSPSSDPNKRLVQQASMTALDAMAELSKKLGTFTPKQTYANDAFGNGFKQIAQLIGSSPATRIVYFSAGGFDTHANQPTTHERLLKQFSDASLAFQRELESIGKDKKVTMLVFSEFGRRAAENASVGTDHGAAAPMLMIGSSVKGGFHGPNPDLNNLMNGDVRFTADFREVYAATVDNWLGGDSGLVLGQQFKPAPVF